MTISGQLLGDTRWQSRIFGGQWTEAGGGALDVVEPANGKVLCKVGAATAKDVVEACKSAAQAQREWAKVTPRERAEILRKAAAALQQDFDPLAGIVARETGGILPKGLHEVKETIALLHTAAALALQPRGEILQSPSPSLSLARRVPRGVVGIISPFNFPLILSMRAVAP